MPRLRATLERLGRLIRQIAGMPDYDRYVAQRSRSCPGEPVLGPSEYYREFVERRYGGSAPTRCC